MGTDNESFNNKLYDLLKVRGYKPVPLDSKNQRVQASQAADVIEFTFRKEGKDYGKAWVSIDDAQRIIVYYDDEQENSPSEVTPGIDYDDTWTGFLTHLKNWAMRKQLDFELSNKDRLGDDMRQRDYYKMKEKVSEGYHAMGKAKSYNDNVPDVKIVLQHSRNIEEGEQRYRNVAKIYLENSDGERILAPTNKPGVAQIYARHLAEGGQPHDERWNHLKGLCEEYNKMAGFVRATRNGEFTESAQRLVQEGINHYNKLRESLSKMRGSRGYNAYFESWSPPLMEDENDDTINELFVQETMDPRIESVMPILSRLRKNVVEMNEVGMLESWAEGVINDKLELDETSEEKLRGYLSGHEERMPAIKAKMNKAGAIVDDGEDADERKKASKEWDALYKTKQRRQKGYDMAKKQLVKKAYGVELDEYNDHEMADTKTDMRRTGDEVTPEHDEAYAKLKRMAPELYNFIRNEAPMPIDPIQTLDYLRQSGGNARQLLSMLKDHIKQDTEKQYDKKHPSLAESMRRFLDTLLNEGLKDTGWMDKDEAEDGTVPAFMRKKKYDDKMKDATGGPAVRTAKNKPEDDLDENFISMDAQAVAEEDDAGQLKGGPIEAYGVHGVKSKQWRKTFRSQAAFEKWLDKNEGNVEVYGTRDLDESLDENLDANQKRVGQLGPTEKVKNNNIGKLVGTNESTEYDEEMARIMEIARFKR